MALFDSFKTVAQNAVEGALGIQRPQKDSQPADFKAPASSSSQAFDKPIQLPVMPWRKERDVSQAPVKSGTQASIEMSAPPADTMPNTYAVSEIQRAPDILQLADAQSAAMMQETQDAINADNSGDEQVVEMMSGTPTQQIVAAKTPVELGLSKATGNLPPVPVNDVPTGPSPAFTKETVRQEQARMQAANAPASANIAQSGAASATGLFNKYRNLNRPDTSYVNALGGGKFWSQLYKRYVYGRYSGRGLGACDAGYSDTCVCHGSTEVLSKRSGTIRFRYSAH